MIIEDYKITQEVFEDIIGRTFVAEKSGTRVLVKVLHKSMARDRELVEAFHDSARLGARLRNESFTRTLSSGTENSLHYVILEYFDLVPLQVFLEHENIFSIFDAPHAVERMAVALRNLHINGEVHGVVTPHCVFFDRRLQRVKIGNFGFEKFLRLLIFNKVRGIAEYLPYFSPEINSGQRHLHRQSDVYSLGILLYRMLIGATPWPDIDLDSFFAGQPKGAIVPPSLQRLEVPDVLDRVVLHAIEPKVDHRCANLSLFVKEISEARNVMLASFTPTTALIYENTDSPLENGPAVNEPAAPTEQASDANEAEAKADELVTEEFIATESDGIEVSNSDDSGDRSLDTDEEQIQALFPETSTFSPDPANLGEQETVETDFEAHTQEQPRTQTSDENTTPVESVFAEVLNEEVELNGDSQSTQAQAPNEFISTDFDVDQELISESDAGEIKMSEPAKQLERELEETHAGADSPPAFPLLQCNEFDDRILSALRREKRAPVRTNGHHQPVLTAPQPAPAVPAPAKAAPAPVAPARPVSSPAPATNGHSAKNQFFDDDDDDQGVHDEEDFATTQTIDITRPRFVRFSGMWFLRAGALAIVSLMVIFLVIAFAFDSDFSLRLRNTITGTNEVSGNTSGQSASRIPERSSANGQVQRQTSPNPGRSSENLTASLTPPIHNTPNNTGDNTQATSRSTLGDNGSSQGVAQSQANGAGNASSRLSAPAQPSQVILTIFAQGVGEPLVADVYIDGRLLGRTNQRGILDITDLQVKRPYLVKVTKAGYADWAKEVVLAAPGNSNLIVRLEAAQALQAPVRESPPVNNQPGQNPESRSPSRVQQESPGRAVARTNTQEASEFGTVDVALTNPEPMSEVYIYVNGSLWNGPGYLAPARLELPAGAYNIEVRKQGFRAVPPSYNVDLLNGETQRISFILTAN